MLIAFKCTVLRVSFVAVLLLMSSFVNANPNHLVPIDPFHRFGYSQAVYDSLIDEIRPDIWMIVRPSFSKEYAVYCKHLIEYKKSSDGYYIYPREIIRDEYVVEWVEPKEKIWKFKEISKNKFVPDIHATHEVQRKKVLLEPGLLERIVKAWTAVVKNTRYEETSRPGLDGTTYQFYAKPGFYGRTWSPDEGIPLDIVNLGELLIKLAKSERGDQEPVLKKADELAGDILEELN